MALKTFERNENAIVAERDKVKGGSKYYSFKQGKTVIRILPPYSDRGVWFKPIAEYYFKFGDADVFLTSPKDSGARDPIGEHISRLYKSGDETQIEKAKDFKPRKRFLVNALVLSDPSGASLKDGVKVVELPVKVKEELVKYDTDVDEGYGDITNLEQGRNITIERTGEALNTRYSVRANVKTSNVFEVAADQGIDPNVWELKNLDAIVMPNSFEELNNALQRKLAELEPQTSQKVAARIPVSKDTTINAAENTVITQGRFVVESPTGVAVPEMPAPFED